MNNKNKKHSPLKDNPLRRSGQSLYEKSNDIVEEVSMYLMWIGLIIFMVFSEWARYYFNTPPNPLGLTFVAIIIIAYFGNKIFGYWKEIKNIRQGCYGEEIVGEYLDELRGKGYKVFHAFVCKGTNGKNFDIDHVLVGPGGVFTIEVKTISKRGDQRISYDGINIKRDGFISDKKPIIQALYQRDWLKKFINKNEKTEVKVKPVVFYPGWYVDQGSVNTEVWVSNPRLFLAYLENEKPLLNIDQINTIAKKIENHNRKI